MSDLNWNKLPWRKSSFSSDSANCVEVAWRTSSFCHQGSCVEVGWTSSSLCAGGDCVQVKSDKAQILVRDSKLGDDSPVLRFAVESWWVLTDAIVTAKDEDKDGRVWMHVRHRSVAYEPDGHVVLSTSVRSPRLRFTEDEWKAFVFGVQVKEFDPDRLSSPVSSSGTEDTGTVESLPVWGLDPEAATGAGDGLRGGVPVPVAAELNPDVCDDCDCCWEPDCRHGCQRPNCPCYVAEITWSEDPSLGEPQGPPAGRPVDASTDEVTLSSAVQPGSDTAGTGVPPDPVPAAPLDDVLAEVAEERVRQTAKHGDQSHLPNGTGPALILRDLPQYQSASRADHLAIWAKARCKAASQNEGGDGSITFEHILTEEWGEAIAESDPVKLRAELIQLAAVAVQWVQAIDRREWARAVAPLVPAVETQETVS
jgi:hypothetical protein